MNVYNALTLTAYFFSTFLICMCVYQLPDNRLEWLHP